MTEITKRTFKKHHDIACNYLRIQNAIWINLIKDYVYIETATYFDVLNEVECVICIFQLRKISDVSTYNEILLYHSILDRSVDLLDLHKRECSDYNDQPCGSYN